MAFFGRCAQTWILTLILTITTANTIDLNLPLDIVSNIDLALAQPFVDFPETPPFDKEYDFIIIGCGGAGTLLANRLSEIPSVQVLCIEAGEKENRSLEEPLSPNPSHFSWNYKTTYQKGICEGFVGEGCTWPRGKALGGSTAVNGMAFSRGSHGDYDEWASQGNNGWSYKEVLPFFKKFEDASKLNLKDTSERGLSGELSLEYAKYQSPVLPYILQSAKELGMPYRDINGKSHIGMSHIQAMLKSGKRYSGASAFIFPVHTRRNLYIAKNTFATKILIDPKTKTATGVEVSIAKETHTYKAKKEVILSAGTINSPQLLMLSGIGPKEHLREMDIDLIKDLPVGKNLKDHVRIFGVIIVGDKVPVTNYTAPYWNYFLLGRGPDTVPVGEEVYAFANLGESACRSFGSPKDTPDIEFEFTGMSSGSLDKVGSGLGLKRDIYQDIFSSLKGKHGFVVQPTILKPKSTGWLNLNSTDPFDHPNIYSNYFHEESDLDTLLCGIRQSINIGLGKPLQQFNVKLHNFKVKPCAKHQFNSDSFWKCLFKLVPLSFYHPIGTCKMAPLGDKTCVVDPKLRVKGIHRLRVVDASIMPEIPSAHLTATVYMIAEKAADMIKEDNGLPR